MRPRNHSNLSSSAVLEPCGDLSWAGLGAMLEDVGSKMMFFHLSWAMLWHLGAKMAHKSARTTQDNHQMIFEVKVVILRCVLDIGASKTLCFTGVEFLQQFVLQGMDDLCCILRKVFSILPIHYVLLMRPQVHCLRLLEMA